MEMKLPYPDFWNKGRTNEKEGEVSFLFFSSSRNYNSKRQVRMSSIVKWENNPPPSTSFVIPALRFAAGILVATWSS